LSTVSAIVTVLLSLDSLPITLVSVRKSWRFSPKTIMSQRRKTEKAAAAQYVQYRS